MVHPRSQTCHACIRSRRGMPRGATVMNICKKPPKFFYLLTFTPLSLSNLSLELAAAAPPLPAALPPRGGAKRRQHGRAVAPAWLNGSDATRLGSGGLELGGHGGSAAWLCAAHAGSLLPRRSSSPRAHTRVAARRRGGGTHGGTR